jgi:hypothetical protein
MFQSEGPQDTANPVSIDFIEMNEWQEPSTA